MASTFERAILGYAKRRFNNPKLRHKDIMEWSTGDIEPHDGEVMVRIEELSVNVCVQKEFDKR